MDTTAQFLRTFYSQTFDSFDEFQCKLRDFEQVRLPLNIISQLTRSIYAIKSSKKFSEASCDRDRLVFSTLEYACNHFDVCEKASINVCTPKNPRNICSSRLSLSAINRKLCINKYNMVHNHLPLPDSVGLDPQLRELSTAESATNDSSISEDTPNKISQSSERKAAARDRLAARAKRDRGIKLAPCLRRLAELASCVSEKRFCTRLNELEILASIWRKGDFSYLLSSSPTSSQSTDIAAQSSVFANSGSLHSSIADSNSLRLPDIVAKNHSTTPSRPRGRPPKRHASSDYGTPPSVTVLSTINLNDKPSTHPYNTRKKRMPVDNTVNYSPLSTFVSQSNSVIGRANGSPINAVKNLLSFPPNFPIINELLLTDLPNGQFQMMNGSKTAFSPQQSNQPILGYILQPIHGVSPFFPSVLTTQPFVPIAPKGPIPEVVKPLQSLPMQPQPPVYKPKCPKPKMNQLRPTYHPVHYHKPASSFSEQLKTDGVHQPWTTMIMEGDSCPYFLYIEDATYFHSASEDAWLPMNQKTEAINSQPIQ